MVMHTGAELSDIEVAGIRLCSSNSISFERLAYSSRYTDPRVSTGRAGWIAYAWCISRGCHQHPGPQLREDRHQAKATQLVVADGAQNGDLVMVAEVYVRRGGSTRTGDARGVGQRAGDVSSRCMFCHFRIISFQVFVAFPKTCFV